MNNTRLHSFATAIKKTALYPPPIKAATAVSLAVFVLSTTHFDSSLAYPYCATDRFPLSSLSSSLRLSESSRTPGNSNNMPRQQEQQQHTSSSPPPPPPTTTTTLPDTMRCIVFGADIGTYKTVTRPVPTTKQRRRGSKNNALLVRVHAVGLNPVDAKVVIGDKLPHHWNRTRQFVHRRMVQDTIVGFDFAGVVVDDAGQKDDSSSGDDNNNNNTFQPGDAVFGTMPPLQGSLAEYISVPLDQVWHMPKYKGMVETTRTCTDQTKDNIDVKKNKNNKKQFQFQQAACLPLVGLTALQCLQPHLLSSKTSIGDANNNNTLVKKSVLIVGASGGTGHVALQVARNLLSEQLHTSSSSSLTTTTTTTKTTASPLYHITAVCSERNADFVQQLGATHVVDYHHTTDNDLVQALQNAPGCPFDVVMDCVTSDDPRDTATIHYPKLLQNPQHHLLSSRYVYRRLGGPTIDWMRAGLARTLFPSKCWWYPNPAEQLFWIRFPKTVEELRILKQWAEQGKLQVEIESVYDFSAEGVQQAMQAILSRRVRGKVVVQVYNEDDDSKHTSNE